MAAHLLGLQVRVPLRALDVVSVVLSGRGFCGGPTTRPEESYRVWCAWVWSRNLSPLGLSCHETQIDISLQILIFCWPCISIYLFLNINQLDALNFIVSLFQAFTCLHGTATYRCDDTRDCIIQFWPPDDQHMCSKHVEAWNKLIIKFSASSWLILRNKLACSVCRWMSPSCLDASRTSPRPACFTRLLFHPCSIDTSVNRLKAQANIWP